MGQRRLSKEESRKRFAEGRELWNEFDPIGVIKSDNSATDDEYENYVGPCLRIVEQGLMDGEVCEYVTNIVYEYMGMPKSPQLDRQIKEFAK